MYLRIIAAVFLIVLGGMRCGNAFEDSIVAVVNDELITAKDVQAYLHTTFVNLKAQGVPEQKIQEIMDDLKTNGLSKLIEDRLILSRANKAGLEVRPQLVDQRLDEILKNYPSENVFLEALAANGSSITELRQRLLEQLKIKYIIDHEVKDKIAVNPQEVTDFYLANPALFQTKDKVFVESIFIGKKSDPAAARIKIEEAETRIKNGGDFIDVAKAYSELPSIGAVERGQLKPEIEDTFFKLPQGGVSAVTEVEDGFYLFKITAYKPAKLAELKDVKDQITERIYQKKFKEKFTGWLNDLKKNAYLEIKK
ncbi:MAG: peptidyl-prolyl cis-trans isomerase [Candidatus Omnitrophica bacterium]|nr:peptidyl-prolyl cis-trans isomerase [Candidatus Omnitrophota bacterium]